MSESHRSSSFTVAVVALGVVFGDIGTSPLYAFKECVNGEHGVVPTPDHVYGVLSLIFWALTMVVAVKYLMFIMRADNDGEGGVLALLALVPEKLRHGRSGVGVLAALVLFGAALLFGDGVITPAISVLSAIEGLEVATPALAPFVVPLTCVVLVGLFAIQRQGTAGIGRVFGPVMVAWFAVIGVLGAVHVAKNPSILAALSPHHALQFVIAERGHSFLVLGSVVLAITGGEALYADMGHFGRKPIRLGWFAVAMPALVLNYFGQGALLLGDPSARPNPFFAMVPTGITTYLLVGLSTAATVIASQALISGVFSLTRQAVQLGYFPRVNVTHTSSETEGQIYIGVVNWGLAAACLALVVGFGASSRLAAAYGIAVTGTMAITSVAYYVIVTQNWHWPRWQAVPLVAVFLFWDLAFFSSNLLKFFEGGYVPILIAGVIFGAMFIWKRGRIVLVRRLSALAPPVDRFLVALDGACAARVPGTGVFLTAQTEGVPVVLVHYLERARSLHERVILLRVAFERVPRVPVDGCATVEPLGHGFQRVVVRIGFMEKPRLLERLAAARATAGLGLDAPDVTFFIGHETFLATAKGEMGRFTESVFAFLYKNASSTTAFFALPAERVMEIGKQIDL